jgi:hypothetical protein
MVMTKFRVGAIIGFTTGYYLGTKAGRQRYVQLNGLLRRLRRTTTIGAAVGKAKAVVDLGKERAGADRRTEPLVDLTVGAHRNN